MRRRQALSLGVIAALIVAIWAAWASGDDPPPPTTIIVSDPTTTTTAPPPTTSTTVTTTPPTTTTAPPTSTTSDPEARTEEVRQILEDLWFGWFDAVFRGDSAAAAEVVATKSLLESFERASDSQAWPRQPSREDITIRDLEILLDREDCLVTLGTVDLSSWLGPEGTTSGVDVMYPSDGSWKFASHWTSRGDLWEADCDAERNTSSS